METYETISATQTPSQDEWRLEPLFKHDAKGKESSWQIGFDGVDHLYMEFGKVGGAIRTTETTVVPKGKRSMQEQALQEARTRYDQKIRKDGYHLKGEESTLIKPMLAKTWIPDKTKIVYPVLTQPKLDGIRCLAHQKGDEIIMRTRNNKPIFHLDHIRDRIKIFLTFLPEGTILDGECYSFVLTFNEITSIVKQQKNPHANEAQVEYFIFDVILPDNPPFVTRYDLLVEAYYAYSDAGYIHFDPEGEVDDPIRIVQAVIAEGKEDLFLLHDEYVQQGYEGLIIRKPQASYIFDRTDQLLKYKNFQDEEGIVVGIREANGTEAGAAVLVIQDPRGNQFPVRFRGSIEERRSWFEHPDLVMGKPATIRYQELTPDGIPRFPVGIAIRDYE